ncbi:MAG: TetR/AcrR family transcriptional regulator [Novosphingobium sp.]|nr:TetR/AcrR family transcriptional regulator [Novosphingobium sp.]
MDAALEEFEEKGYTGATTAAIARRAEVAEALLFNHFGSKAQLFKDTIFQPLSQLFDTFLAEHPASPDNPELTRANTLEYIGEIRNLIAGHPRMLLSLVFAQCYKTGEVDGLADVQGLHDYFARSAEQASSNLKSEPRIDPELMARISFVSIMSSIVFQDWLFPDGRWDRGQIHDAIAQFVLDGLNANHPAR